MIVDREGFTEILVNETCRDTVGYRRTIAIFEQSYSGSIKHKSLATKHKGGRDISAQFCTVVETKTKYRSNTSNAMGDAITICWSGAACNLVKWILYVWGTVVNLPSQRGMFHARKVSYHQWNNGITGLEMSFREVDHRYNIVGILSDRKSVV